MTVYLVTTLSEEQDTTGKILRANVNVHGVYSGQEKAESIASKYGGTVQAMTLDSESTAIVEYWENPGYYSE
jgi:hypothetical protein